MLHHHGGAGSPYEARTAGEVQFSLPPPPTGPVSFTGIPPPPMQLQPAGTSASFGELPSAGAAEAANFHDDEEAPASASASASGAGASSGSGGSRWPREETLALIRIRSEMDAAFRSAPLKAPLWEDVARKLAELGYRRSAHKCKEKFDNVDKYYRRTKESRAGRHDGKSYRFFSQLEALHAAAHRQPQGAAMATTVQADPRPSGAMAWAMPPGAGLPDLSVSSMSGSESSESRSDDELDVEDEEVGGGGEGEGGGCDEEMMALFEGMMRQVAEKQDAMQRAFMETLDRWEAERTAREEAWRLKEVARMNREREQLARERAAAASRDAALIAFLQRVGGVQLPPPPDAVVARTPTPAAMPDHDAAATSLHHLVPAPPQSEADWALAVAGGESGVPMPSRWPKEEVQALIQLRTEKDGHYHDAAGAKGPLWEDIAAGMRRIGYNRSAKRCKEKWENINKYFKKVKESNKRRPEDSKTCPYFHQLDAIYRKKRFAGGGSNSDTGASAAVAVAAAFEQENASQRELEGKSSNDVGKRNNTGKESVQAPPGYGSETAPTATAIADGAENKKAEGFGRETNVQRPLTADEADSDDMEREHAEDDKARYTAGLQKPNVSGSGASVPAPGTSAAATPASSASAAPTGSTFLAVQ
ncbi:hypothetical protein ACP4OV_000517 [Aristida adscensionis]